ncbi:hypothetical protein ACNO5M_25595 [Vibrio owensii]|uniref:hypothetical protein n=1 Tax=Vibrio owensii TaxID=696485 RepID=UPI003AB08E1A
MKKWNLILIAFLSGCVSAPNGETSRIQSDLNFDDTVKLVDDFTKACWEREASLFSDQIITRKVSDGEKAQYILGRDNDDIPFMPFANIYVLKSPDAATDISIEEGSVSMMKSWGVERKLSNWLKGDYSCE